jgi:lipopolysaccharide transport system ATP-binding protein
VLAVGDAEFQRQCLDKMQSVVRDGRTIVFVSHNMAAIKTLCQRAILLDGGRVAHDGDVHTIVDRYLAAGRSASDDGAIGDDVPRSGTGEARLRRAVITTPSSPSASQVFLGEPLSVDMTFEVTKPLRDVMLSVGISSMDGVRIATAYNVDGNRELWSFAPGWHRVVVDLDVVLLPRRYTLDVAMIWSNGNEIDYVQQARDFSALNVSRGGDDQHRWQTVHGYIRPNSRWHQPVPAPAAPGSQPN